MSLATRGYQIIREDGPFTLAKKGATFAITGSREITYKVGRGRTCPICGFTGRKFSPAGMPKRREAQCQKCGARERHRLLWHYLRNETDFAGGGKDILYFAPTNNILDELRECGNNVITADLLMDDVEVKTDITRLPFEDDCFDGILCSHVLEHIPDDSAAMSEMRRVLSSDGDALVMIPKDKGREQTYEDDSITSPEARRREFGQGNHVRWYGRDFPERLSKSGFNVSTVTYADSLDGEVVKKHGLRLYDQRLGRTRFEDIHHCRLSAD